LLKEKYDVVKKLKDNITKNTEKKIEYDSEIKMLKNKYNIDEYESDEDCDIDDKKDKLKKMKTYISVNNKKINKYNKEINNKKNKEYVNKMKKLGKKIEELNESKYEDTDFHNEKYYKKIKGELKDLKIKKVDDIKKIKQLNDRLSNKIDELKKYSGGKCERPDLINKKMKSVIDKFNKIKGKKCKCCKERDGIINDEIKISNVKEMDKINEKNDSINNEIDDLKKKISVVETNIENDKKTIKNYSDIMKNYDNFLYNEKINVKIYEMEKEYNSMKDKIKNIEELKNKKEMLKTENDKFELKIKNIQNEIKIINKNIKHSNEKKESICIIDKLNIELKTIKETLCTDEVKLSDLNDETIDMKKDIDLLDNRLKDLNVLININNEKKRKYSLYDEIEKSINAKGGMYDQLLKNTAIPEIESMLNELLSKFKNMYTVKLILDEDGLSIVKQKDGSLLSGFSSSEMNLFNLIFRVVLSCISKKTQSFYVIDEVFDGFDAENKENVEKLLLEMKNYFKWILLVSHDSRIKNLCDNTIYVKKDEHGYSHLSQIY
jgi:DNA repair exonuclease SbcCD ATPase subunit